MSGRSDALQALCRSLLLRLRPLASGRGLGECVDSLVSANVRGECAATEDEVELLARAADDERLSRKEVPSVVGKSYRQCVESSLFERIRTLKRVGIYSKVSAILNREK